MSLSTSVRVSPLGAAIPLTLEIVKGAARALADDACEGRNRFAHDVGLDGAGTAAGACDNSFASSPGATSDVADFDTPFSAA
jgi:hypothetical protein